MKFVVEIDVMPHAGISDPQGQTIERALPRIGFDGIESVRVGKHLELLIEAETEQAALDQVRQACERFLANPVIEEYRVHVRSVIGA